MAIVERKRPALPVPYAMELPDRVPKERYFDQGFFELEAELADGVPPGGDPGTG